MAEPSIVAPAVGAGQQGQGGVQANGGSGEQFADTVGSLGVAPSALKSLQEKADEYRKSPTYAETKQAAEARRFTELPTTEGGNVDVVGVFDALAKYNQSSPEGKTLRSPLVYAPVAYHPESNTFKPLRGGVVESYHSAQREVRPMTPEEVEASKAEAAPQGGERGPSNREHSSSSQVASVVARHQTVARAGAEPPLAPSQALTASFDAAEVLPPPLLAVNNVVPFKRSSQSNSDADSEPSSVT